MNTKRIVRLAFLSLMLSFRISAQTDSIQAKHENATQVAGNRDHEQPIVIPPLEDRLVILTIGAIAVGGLGLLLNAKRRKLP